MNKITQGNILNITEGIIIHQVNCQGVAGAGLAKQIADKWPNWLTLYKNDCKKDMLGTVSIYFENSGLSIANLFSQSLYGRDKRYTNYAALGRCLFELRMVKSLQIYIPYGIGCGLAGGDWNIVSEIIYDALPSAIIVKWDGKS